jgi:CHASE2 domain-containing sensor protein
MRRAARTDANQEAVVQALRDYGCSVAVLSGAGVPGLPDLLVASPPSEKGMRKVGLVECKDGSKSPSRRALTADQIKFWTEWKNVPMAIVTDVDGALRFARLLTFEGMT